MSVYPKWIFHKTEPAKIVNDEAEHAEAGEGWEETPAAFDQESNEAAQESASTEDKNPDIKKVDFSKMTVKQLKETLIEKGVDESEVKDLKKDELIVMLGSI